MTSTIKYVGMDVHKESISIAVRNAAGKIVMECVIETKAGTILQFFDGLRGEVQVTFEEGTWAAWLYDLLKPHVTKVVVCDPRRNALLLEGKKVTSICGRCWYKERITFWDPLGKTVTCGAGGRSSPREEGKTARNERWERWR